MKTGWISELDGLNFLALADVVIDIRQESQLTGPDVEIPLYQQVVKFQALLPANTSGLIDRACDLRWKALKLLERQKIISNVVMQPGGHRWESSVYLRLDQRRLATVFVAINQEARLRAAAHTDNNSPAPTTQEVSEFFSPDTVTLKWLYEKVPVRFWLSAVAILLATFYLGARLSDVSVVRAILRLPPPVADFSRSPGTLVAVPGDLVVQLRGNPTSPLRVIVNVAATGGNVTLQREAEIKEVKLDPFYFVSAVGHPSPELQSVMVDPPVLTPGAEGGIAIDFRPLSLIPRHDAFSGIPADRVTAVGHIKLSVKYQTVGRDEWVNLRIPVFIQT